MRSGACVALALTAVRQTRWHHRGGKDGWWRSEEKDKGGKSPDAVTQEKHVDTEKNVIVPVGRSCDTSPTTSEEENKAYPSI